MSKTSSLTEDIAYKSDMICKVFYIYIYTAIYRLVHVYNMIACLRRHNSISPLRNVRQPDHATCLIIIIELLNHQVWVSRD